jgi:hypothetical protein
VVWHQLIELSQELASAAESHRIATAVLDVVRITLLLLPWVGSFLLLTMMMRRPAQWLWRRGGLTRRRAGRS